MTAEFIVKVENRISFRASDLLGECQTAAEGFQVDINEADEAIREHRTNVDDAISEASEFVKQVESANS